MGLLRASRHVALNQHTPTRASTGWRYTGGAGAGLALTVGCAVSLWVWSHVGTGRVHALQFSETLLSTLSTAKMDAPVAWGP
jgi:hypothetical protein